MDHSESEPPAVQVIDIAAPEISLSISVSYELFSAMQHSAGKLGISVDQWVKNAIDQMTRKEDESCNVIDDDDELRTRRIDAFLDFNGAAM